MCLVHQDNFALVFLASPAQISMLSKALTFPQETPLILFLKKCSKNCSVVFVVNGGKDIICQAGHFSMSNHPVVQLYL